jgi:glycosyltransferase involved in cell wall biosynthesis
MRIGIDCRHIDDFGIGTYTRGLLHGLTQIARAEEYVAFVGAERRQRIPDGFEIVIADAPMFSIREQLALPPLIRRARLDVYHAPHYAAPLTGTALVSSIHDTIQLHYFPARWRPHSWAYAMAMTARTIRASARVLTLSDASREEIVRTFDCEPQRVVVAPCGVDEIFFAPAAPERRFGRYFLFAGATNPQKNTERLLDAFRIVRARHGDVSLVFAGRPPRGAGAIDGVIVAGRVPLEELIALYRGAVATVLPSLMEGFGLPPLESMAGGTPAIAADRRPMSDLLGDDALLVDPLSVDSIAQGMLRLLEDDALRASLAQRGPARAARYTWRRCAEIARAAYLAAAAER